MKRLILSLLIASTTFPAAQVEAAEIRVLTMASFQPVMNEILPAWEKSTGNKAIIVVESPPNQEKRLANGETFDIVLSKEENIRRIEKDGKYAGFKPVAVIGISVAVRNGAPKPDISTPNAFKAAMLAANSIASPDPSQVGSSGYVMAQIFDRLGIGAEMKPKFVIVRSPVSSAVPVAAGQADVALQQASELVGAPGVTVVGPLPPELQDLTIYLAGLNTNASEPARSLLAVMTGPQTRALLDQKGMIAP